ncbi:4'-phosphopantetheinyl transferase family protein [Algoriphagus namhaensis]|uniref:4'-phosphopantetheinyl transferase family protein n=1 Tax=Algoriphagus namhaensis TaxID=915353 RepID=A0ABV8AU83_9BACT
MKVELWTANLSEIQDVDPSHLSKDELQRLEKFIYPKHRDLFIKRRSMLRKLSGEYLGIHPKSIRFGYSSLGKPFIAFSKEKLYFNSSHSKDHVAIGFSRDGQLGVDLEFLDPEIEAELISTHFFGSDEISAIQAAKGLDRANVFFRHWCIKEAYIKFIGKGLTYPLDQVLVRSVSKNPWLEILRQKNKPSKVIDTVCYLDSVSNFGLAVVGDSSELEIELKEWKG